MTNRELLYEDYEDALFAILMDELAQKEGEQLLELNQHLQDDPDAAIPDEVRQRCIDVINREFAKKRRVASVQRAKKVLKILPWAVVIAMALMAVAMAAFPNFRVGVYNIIKARAEEYTSWQIGEQSNKIPDNIDSNLSFSISPPIEYYVTEVYSGGSFENVEFKSEEDPDSIFTITVFRDNNTLVNVDTENSELYKSYNFMGCNVEVFTKGTQTRIIWTDTDTPEVVVVESNNIDVDTIIAIAKSFQSK